MSYLASQYATTTTTGVDYSPYANETGAVPITWYGGKLTFSIAGVPTFFGTTAPPAAGLATVGIFMSSTAGFGIFCGSAAPTFTAAKGSLYLRTDGTTTNDRAYINTDAGTTWTALTTAA